MRKSVVAGVVAIASGLAACGSSGPSKSATTTPRDVSSSVVLTSIRTTAAAQTARAELQMKMTDGTKGSFAATAEGVTDFTAGDSDVTMQFDGPIGTVMGDGFEVRSVEGTVYTRVPSSVQLPFTNGKPWIAVDVPNRGGSLSSPFDLGGQTDPSKALAYLETVSNDVKAVGSEQIRGVDTTHYTATLDLAKAVDAQNKDLPAGLRNSVKQLSGLLGNVPTNVWIDGDGRLRRLSLVLDMGEMFRGLDPSASTPQVVMTETLDLYDFGVPVHVAAPPADQVSHVPSFGDLGARGGGSRGA